MQVLMSLSQFIWASLFSGCASGSTTCDPCVSTRPSWRQRAPPIGATCHHLRPCTPRAHPPSRPHRPSRAGPNPSPPSAPPLEQRVDVVTQKVNFAAESAADFFTCSQKRRYIFRVAACERPIEEDRRHVQVGIYGLCHTNEGAEQPACGCPLIGHLRVGFANCFVLRRKSVTTLVQSQ